MSKLISLWMRAFTLGCLVAGPCICLLAVVFAIRTKLFLNHARPANGTVVRLEPKEADDHSINYAPLFQFASSDGTPHLITSNTGSNPPSFAIGQHVPVLYAAADPDNAKIATFGQLWFLPIAFAFVGFSTFAAGLFLSRANTSQSKQLAVGTLSSNGTAAKLSLK